MPKRVDVFVVYSAQKEISTAKMAFENNSLLKFFKEIKTLAQFKALKLPLVQTMAVKEAEKWASHPSSGELHYQELGEMRRGIGPQAA